MPSRRLPNTMPAVIRTLKTARDTYKTTPVVTERAIGTDQGQKFVYVVDDKNLAQYRRIKVGRLHQGLREIKDGLEPTERVVVTGLQRVRPGAEVDPKLVEATGTSTVAN